MKKACFICLLLLVASLALSAVISGATSTQYSKYLTTDDIQKITGLKEVKAVPRDPAKGFGGDLNFTSAGKALLMVQILSKENYPTLKKLGNGGVVKDVGEEAVQGATMPGFPPNFVCFKKGSFCVTVTTYFNPENPSKNMLTMEQLIPLARTIAGRM